MAADPPEITYDPRSSLNVTIEHDGHRSEFTALGDGPAVVAAFRVWLERLPTTHSADALDLAAAHVAPAGPVPSITRPYVDETGLHGVAPRRRKKYQPGPSTLLKDILGLLGGVAYVEMADLTARFDKVQPSKISAALDEGVRSKVLTESRDRHGLRWRRAK
jgi:hypothetical protein